MRNVKDNIQGEVRLIMRARMRDLIAARVADRLWRRLYIILWIRMGGRIRMFSDDLAWRVVSISGRHWITDSG